MIGMRSRSDVVGHTPNAAVVLNFTPPRHGIPSLLSFDQVRTLFSKVYSYNNTLHSEWRLIGGFISHVG